MNRVCAAAIALSMFGLLVPAALAQSRCGEVATLETHSNTTTRYALAYPPQGAKAALVLLAGGGGHVDLDEQACPRALKGNSLLRSLPHFHAAGFATAVVDAPSDHMDGDGLGGFRSAAQHAEDLGKVIADVRIRTKKPVWVVGTSRGAISAANAASRLSGAAAPDGVVLTSALMSGHTGGRKPWVAQTVFDLPLEAIRMPVLVVGHAEDRCVRSPPELMPNITARTNSAREQVATIEGGPGKPAAPNIDVCEGRTPHGFLDQEADAAAGIARFIGGGKF
jgi:hypothetical protein